MLPYILRRYCTRTGAGESGTSAAEKAAVKVMLLDGECDPNQMEMMESILNNDGFIVLGNHERIPISANVRFIWEVSSSNILTLCANSV